MKSEQIEQKIYEKILKGIEVLNNSIEDKIYYNCPNCGKPIYTELCVCGFDINETLSCPFKVSLRCIHTEEKCDVEGLDYEDCELYLKKAGI